jgi:hypothetical protein
MTNTDHPVESALTEEEESSRPVPEVDPFLFAGPNNHNYPSSEPRPEQVISSLCSEPASTASYVDDLLDVPTLQDVPTDEGVDNIPDEEIPPYLIEAGLSEETQRALRGYGIVPRDLLEDDTYRSSDENAAQTEETEDAIGASIDSIFETLPKRVNRIKAARIYETCLAFIGLPESERTDVLERITERLHVDYRPVDMIPKCYLRSVMLSVVEGKYHEATEKTGT